MFITSYIDKVFRLRRIYSTICTYLNVLMLYICLSVVIDLREAVSETALMIFRDHGHERARLQFSE